MEGIQERGWSYSRRRWGVSLPAIEVSRVNQIVKSPFRKRGFLVVRDGVDPSTSGFSDQRSTD